MGELARNDGLPTVRFWELSSILGSRESMRSDGVREILPHPKSNEEIMSDVGSQAVEGSVSEIRPSMGQDPNADQQNL